MKAMKTGKEEVKLSLFIENKILYLKYPENYTSPKTLRTENTYSKVAQYKINI
jgi:hypothetical protein